MFKKCIVSTSNYRQSSFEKHRLLIRR